jgi:hypothetical protein
MIVVNAIADEVTPGAGKGVSRVTFNADGLQERKAAALCVISEDLLRFAATAGPLLEQSLRTAVAGATDASFIAAMIAVNAPIGSTGDPLSDVEALLNALALGDGSALHLVMSPANAQKISVTRPAA